MIALRLAWRHLRGRGARSLLTTLAVVFGVMLIFGLNGVTPALADAFSRGLLSTAGKIDLTVTSAYGQPVRPGLVDAVARVPGIAVASPLVERPVPVPGQDDVPQAERVTQVTVVGVDPATAARLRDVGVTDGRALEVGDADVAVLAGDLAGRLSVGVGDELVLPSSVGTARLTVVGLLSAATVPGQEIVYLPLASAQRLLGFGDRLTGVEATFEPGVDRTATEDAVRAAVGDDYRVGGLSSNSSLLASIEVASFTFTMFGVFALATAGFIILNSFRTVVAERRRDIGMLRAIGMGRRSVEAVFLAESLLQGLVGTALGILAGMGMASGLFALMTPVLEDFVHIRLGSPVYTPGTWALAIALGVGVTVLSAVVPARAAGRVTPMEAMRPQVGEVYERRVGVRAWVGVGLVVVSLFCLATRHQTLVGVGAVVFLIAIALVAPAIINPVAQAFGHAIELLFAREGAIARSNLQRNPGRSAVTVTAVMLGLASIVAMMSVVASIFIGFIAYIDKSLASDYLLIPRSIVLSQGNVAAGPALASEVRTTTGVGAVSTLRVAMGRADGTDVQVIGIDPVTYPQVATFEWATPTTDAALGQLASGRWVIANGIYAAQNGLEPGDALALRTPNGPRTYFVAGIGNDYLNAKLATVYTSQANLSRDFNAETDLLVLANRRPGADPDAVAAALQRVVDDYPAFSLYEAQQWRDEQLTTFNASIVIFYALVAVLALPSLLALVNTLAISVLARTREIGMLRAVGATRRQIRRMVMAESLLLTTIGTSLAVLAGVWLGYALVQAMGAVGWEMPWVMPWAAVAVTLVVGIVFGVLAALGPARSASSLDVVAALHHE